MWEIKTKDGSMFSDARAEYIEYGAGMAKMMVQIEPKQVKKHSLGGLYTWEETVQEAEYQAVLVIPLDNVAYIRLKTKEEKDGIQ
jgi:hypothetical protein